MVQVRTVEGVKAMSLASTATFWRPTLSVRLPRALKVAAVITAGFLAAAVSDFAFAAESPQPASFAATAARPNCGGDVACTVPLGSYRIALPADGRVEGAYVFFHGYRSSAAEQMGATDLIAVAHAHHLAFVAPDGLYGTWSHDNAVRHDRDETAFSRQVFDDLTGRWHVPADRLIVGGFSQGASTAWHVICHAGDRVAAAVTFSGVFWNPLPAPAGCATIPPPMIHFHGTADQTFPLAGRAIGDRWHQGDMYLSLDVVRARAECRVGPRVRRTVAGIDCIETDGCDRGPILACVHDAGHEVRAGWLAGALDTLLAPSGALARVSAGRAVKTAIPASSPDGATR